MNSNNITFALLEKIEKANSDFSLFEGADRILVGLSGGADSTCLLLSLKSLSQKYGFTLCALHVNHMIRGKEADRDEIFARNLCHENGIEFVSERVDVPALSKNNGESLELCARNVRYSLFSKICKERSISHVATAHNACDNAETVLFNLIRGTGIKGLCGIPPKRNLGDGVCVIRPLIYAERTMIEEYLSAESQGFVTDSTNSDTDYTRNFIRREIIPLMKKINPSLEDGITRSTRLLRTDENYLSKIVLECMTDKVDELSRLDVAVLSRMIASLFSKVSDETLSEYHIMMLCDKIYGYDGTKDGVSFPDSFKAKLYRNRLSFEKDERKKHSEKIEFCKKLSEGSTFFEESLYALYISFDVNKDIPQTLSHEENIYKIYTTDYLYFDTIPFGFAARNKRDGDKILSCGMHKSLKRLLCASDFEGNARSLLPVIEYNGRIVLVPGVCTCDDNRRDRGAANVSVSLYIKQ